MQMLRGLEGPAGSQHSHLLPLQAGGGEGGGYRTTISVKLLQSTTIGVSYKIQIIMFMFARFYFSSRFL